VHYKRLNAGRWILETNNILLVYDRDKTNLDGRIQQAAFISQVISVTPLPGNREIRLEFFVFFSVVPSKFRCSTLSSGTSAFFLTLSSVTVNGSSTILRYTTLIVLIVVEKIKTYSTYLLHGAEAILRS
jgi:hypothetical protein